MISNESGLAEDQLDSDERERTKGEGKNERKRNGEGGKSGWKKGERGHLRWQVYAEIKTHGNADEQELKPR